jgi:tRNA(His) 5'-end guanylyltransferase
MNKKDSLGDRMKGYEQIDRKFLMRRNPVIIRLDGKAFHTFTRGMLKPFDPIMQSTMQATMKYLCENIQGCKIGYTQSDEITLLLVDYDTLTTDAWFGNNIQKMVSVSASMATLAFNKNFKTLLEAYDNGGYYDNMSQKFDMALFDSRVFSIPKEEVMNCFIWRQNDATRNSIQSVGQANFSHKQLHCKSTKDICDMLINEKEMNWNDFPTTNKRGSCCVKDENGQWIIDNEIPIFTQDRDYVEKFIFVG